MEKHNQKAPEGVTFIREKTYTLPSGSAKTALLPAILGDVNAGGGGAPIERENEGEMDHFVTIENRKRNDSEKGKFIQVENKIQRKMIEAAD